MTCERWASIRRVWEIAVAASAILALAAIGACAYEAMRFLHDCRESAQAVTELSGELRADFEHLKTVTLPAADDLIQKGATVAGHADTAITDTSKNLNNELGRVLALTNDLKRTVQDTNGVVNLARDTLRDEQGSIKAANERTLSSMAGFDQNMQEIAKLLADPHLKDTFAQADGILADTHAMTSAALPAVKRYAAPPTRKQRILQNVKDLAAVTYLGLRIALQF